MPYIFTFSLAIFLTSYFPELPNVLSLSLLLCCGVLCLYPRYYFLSSLIFGVLVGCLHGAYIVDKQLPDALVKKELIVEGVITELPIETEKKVRFVFTVDSVQRSNQGNDHSFGSSELNHLIGKKLQLSWYKNHWGKKDMTPIPTLIPSQRWRLTVKLKRPRGLVNPAGFDYQAHLLRQNIIATGYVRSQPTNQLLEPRIWQAPVDYVRWRIQQQLLALSDNNAVAAPLIALAIGDTQWITSEQWQLLKNTGTIHLLAISGLHIGLAAGIGFFVGRLIMRILAIWYPFSLFQLFVPPLTSILLASTYSLLAGMSLPTQRALLMVIVFHISALFYGRISAFSLLGSALCFIAITDPLAVYSQGFWLSFLAVAVLMYGFYGRNTSVSLSIPKSTRITMPYSVFSLVKAQWLVTVGLFVPSVIWLQGVSISAPLANLFAVSWVSLLVVPLIFLLLVCILLAAGFLPVPDALMAEAVKGIYGGLEQLLIGLLYVLDLISVYTAKFWYPAIHSLSLTTILLAITAVTVILLPKGFCKRWLALIGLLPLFYSASTPPFLRMTVLDVGQGTAIVIETPDASLVYDTGRFFSQRFDIGQHVLTPYLRSIGIHHLTKLIVSHKDGDHAGGVNGLLQNIASGQVLYGQEIPLEDAGMSHKQCLEGQRWRWDDVQFSVLWPTQTALKQEQNNNNLSCVLLIESLGQRILLAGDIEASVEKNLVNHPLLAQGVDILLVPHHGSQTSSSLSWLRQLNPQWAIVSAGYQNAYGHPHPTVQARYEALSSRWMNTAEQGAMRWTLSQSKDKDRMGEWKVESWRKDYARYWFGL